MPGSAEDPKTVEELKEREKEIVRKLHSILWENRWGEEFTRTRTATIAGIVGVTGTWLGLRLFRPRGLLNVPILVSVGVGAALHWISTLSKDVQAACELDTSLGNTLRLHYQHLSTYNILIPHYRHATLKASKSRSDSI